MLKSAILLSLSLALMAADEAPQDKVNFHDIRVTLVGLPTDFSTHLENKSTKKSYDYSGSVDSAGELSIGYQFSHHADQNFAVIIGGNLDFIGTEEKSNGATETTSNVGPSLHLGVSLRPVDFLNLEGLVFGGLGSSDDKVTGLYTKDISSDSGYYTKVGAELRAVLTMGPGFQLFAELGYVAIRQTLKYSADTSINLGELEFTNRSKGLMYGLGAGWRF